MNFWKSAPAFLSAEEGNCSISTDEKSARRADGAQLELWSGIECSFTRIGDRYHDQLARCGHSTRNDDLGRIARLGVRTLRYPVLWEHHAADATNWLGTGERLSELRSRNIEPIVGLVHHGSGPPDTSLLDEKFSRGLAAHAAAVAERYPWVKFYNPINEPLTTARFSALYGIWYPHKRDARSFVRALLNQCDAIRRAMAAIREINSDAKLIQTEDMGYTFSTPLLAYQADFENGRRWLSFDILSGWLDEEHPFWDHFIENGVSERELMSFVEQPCPPDILGINHYITSERFLDERLERYPVSTHGGNEKHAYADVAAVRVCSSGTLGPSGILRQVWERYHRPIAVTEAHLGCTREEQLRWLMEVWRAGKRLREEGADIRAITVWSLLGAYDWSSLLTRDDGHYEPGTFDLRAPEPRPTILAKCIPSLITRGDYEHPVLASEGWWRRSERLLYPAVSPSDADQKLLKRFHVRTSRSPVRPILIAGATGTLGRGFKQICDARGLPCMLLNRQEMDIADCESVFTAITRHRPWAVINTAGYVRVDDAESDRRRCFRENTLGAICLAKVCADLELPFVTFSSDLIFNGRKREPYVEADLPEPLNVYGHSKLQAECAVLARHPGALIIRTSAFFGPWDEYNFVTQTRRKFRLRTRSEFPSDATVSPTYVPDLIHSSLDLLIDGECGVWHLANVGAITWSELARRIAIRDGHSEDLIEPKPLESFSWPARRPLFSALSSQRAAVMPQLEDALDRYFFERNHVEQNSGVCLDVH